MDAVQKNEAEVENQLQRRVSLKYSKEKLLKIREESAISKFRPKCLQDRFDCEGVWDPERWHAAALPDSAVAMVSEDWVSGPNGRPAAKRRSSDPRERLRDEVDVVLSPQRRSFGGGCHVASLSTARQVQSHPEGLSEVRASQLSNGRRVGSGRVVVRTFDREPSGRERRNRGEARRPGDRRRKDEVEPEWFSAGPISQSETIELKGFLEDERGKAGGNERGLKAASIKEKPGENGFDAVLPSEPAVPAFDLNEFLEKGLPGLAVMEEETSSKTAAFSRFSQWFRGSGGHRDGGSGIGPCDRQAVMREDPKSRGFVHAHEEKVDILDLLRKAKVDVAPILGNLVANHDYLKDSAQSGKVRSVSELEAELTTSTCLAPQASHMPSAELSAPHSAPIMVSELEQALGGQDFINPRRGPKRDGSDMSAFSRLVQSMKAGGTLPSRPVDVGASRGSIPDASMEPSRIPTHTVPQKNLLLDLLGSSGEVKLPSPPIACLPDLLRVGTSSPKPSSVSLTSRLQDCTEFSGKDLLENLTSPLQGVLPMMASTPPASTSPGMDGFRKDVEEQRARIAQQSPHSPTTVAHNANSFSPNQTATTSSMLSPAFTPTSVIRKMHASRERRGSEVGNETQLAENGGEVSAKDRISASTPSSPTLIYDSFPPPLPHRPRAMHPRPSMLPVTNPQAGMALLGPPGLHPNMLQRMLATEGVRGVHPRGMPTGMFADGTAGHLLPTPHPYPINPLFTSQAMALASRLPHSSAFHFAMLQQRLSQTATSQTHFAVPGALRAARAGRGTPSVTGGSRHSPTPHPALARWFGKEILQQPLPSMPNHVISVDDLELRPGI